MSVRVGASAGAGCRARSVTGDHGRWKPRALGPPRAIGALHVRVLPVRPAPLPPKYGLRPRCFDHHRTVPRHPPAPESTGGKAPRPSPPIASRGGGRRRLTPALMIRSKRNARGLSVRAYPLLL